jgi:hypothetical protein
LAHVKLFALDARRQRRRGVAGFLRGGRGAFPGDDPGAAGYCCPGVSAVIAVRDGYGGTGVFVGTGVTVGTEPTVW